MVSTADTTASTACFDLNGLTTFRRVFRRNELDERCLGGACTRTPHTSLNTPADGVISNQDVDAEEYVTRAGTGWEFGRDPDEGLCGDPGNFRQLGVEADGFIGPERSLFRSSTLKIRKHDL